MLELFLQVILMIGLSAMLLLAARAVPRVPSSRKTLAFSVEKWLESLPLHKLDEFLKNSSLKALRKLRLVILKIDNRIGEYLEKTKEANGVNGKGEKFQVDKLIENSDIK